MNESESMDRVWKALADPTRRAILDLLRDGPLTTTEIVERFPELSRFGVMKHLDVLRAADLVLSREQGRSRINSLNAVPIRMIYERWVSGFHDHWATGLVNLKKVIEARSLLGAQAARAPRPRPRSDRKNKETKH